MATRNLSFVTTVSQGVSEDTTLALTFMPLNDRGLYDTQFPVIWKTMQFRAKCTGSFSVVYTSRLGVATANVVSGTVQNPQLNFVEIGLGQTTALSVIQGGSQSWSEPQPKPAPGNGPIIARNGTAQVQHIAAMAEHSP